LVIYGQAADSRVTGLPLTAPPLVDTALSELGGINILINSVGSGDADRLGLGGSLNIGDVSGENCSISTCSVPSGQLVRRCPACSTEGA